MDGRFESGLLRLRDVLEVLLALTSLLCVVENRIDMLYITETLPILAPSLCQVGQQTSCRCGC